MTDQHSTSSANGVDASVAGPKSLHLAKDIPQATVTRLATYLRVLSTMVDDGTLIVSSEELAAAAGVGSAKLRKDLSFLGPNGVRGVGYDVARLRARIEIALGLDQGHRVILVGVGNLGRALAGYGGFGRRGFSVVGLFDTDPGLIGSAIAGVDVRDFDDLEPACAELEPTIAVIAVPDTAAQQTCDRLVAAGLRCILSFSPLVLSAPAHVEIRRVDLAVEMQMLSFSSARNAEGDNAGLDTSAVAEQCSEPAVTPAARESAKRLGRSRGPRSAATVQATGEPAPTSNGSVVRP